MDRRERRMKPLLNRHQLIRESRVLRVKGSDENVAVTEEEEIEQRGLAHHL